MDSADLKSEAPAPLPIRSRCTYGAHDEVDVARTVYCPRRRQSVDVGICHQCDCYAGTSVVSPQALLMCTASAARKWHATQPSVPGHMPSEADRTPVAFVMTRTVICVRPGTSVADLCALLVEQRISALPVVDARGHAIGVVSKTDLLREAVEGDDEDGLARMSDSEGGGLPAGLVEDLMVQCAFTLSEHARISEAAARMAFEGVHRLPVVDDQLEVVGIVSALDILTWLARHDGYVFGSGHARPRF